MEFLKGGAILYLNQVFMSIKLSKEIEILLYLLFQAEFYFHRNRYFIKQGYSYSKKRRRISCFSII